MPVVGQREACPCGSGKRYKACHGRTVRQAFVPRPFEGRVDETDWVALREIVPSASARITVVGHEDRDVRVSTVLPMSWPAMVRADGRVLLALQSAGRSGDVSRDLAQTLLLALDAAPGSQVAPDSLPGEGPRLQDLLDPAPMDVTVHAGFDHWLDGVETDAETRAQMDSANESVTPTERLTGVSSGYWCRIGDKCHLRWVLPDAEEVTLDALARLGTSGLSLGEGTRYVGSFRAYGLLVPVWDLPVTMAAADLEAPTAALRGRLDEVLADPRELTRDEVRTRSGLINRQVTLR